MVEDTENVFFEPLMYLHFSVRKESVNKLATFCLFMKRECYCLAEKCKKKLDLVILCCLCRFSDIVQMVAYYDHQNPGLNQG